MKLLKLLLLLALFVGRALGATPAAEAALVLTNHLGYEATGPKHAVIRGAANEAFSAFVVKSFPDERVAFRGDAVARGRVDRWRDWHFWTLDFNALQGEGVYFIECRAGEKTLRSQLFWVRKNLLERHTLADVVFYFKGQRCTGALDRADRAMTFLGSRPGTVDVHGGWFDASGDYGKHLSHLAYSTYHNPQQIPLVVFNLLKTHERLKQSGDENFAQDLRRILDEALHGADFLVRMKSPEGSFYETISNRGPAKKPEDRRITPIRGTATPIKLRKPTEAEFQKQTAEAAPPASSENYEVSWRGGGGMAIAALALASRYPAEGEFAPADYVRTAETAFAFLTAHNRELTNDGKENIVDDYCALLAATELFRATSRPVYADAARERAEKLLGRLMVEGEGAGHWRADDGSRPFFHAADAGLPVVSLLYYREIADVSLQSRIAAAVRRSLETELRITDAVANPFGLARQYVQNKAGERRATFFYPHDSDSAPWWQGENARLASLAAAARLAAPLFADDAAFQERLRAYAANQLNWILGLNPFDACMLHGTGRNNPEYYFFGTYQYRNAPGGIVNGITSGLKDATGGIDFNLTAAESGGDHDWRWGEQWLPHAAWYLLAVAAAQGAKKD
jgi:hypothetical protein